MELSDIKAISSLVILFEKIFKEKEFSQENLLVVADSKNLKKLKSFLLFKNPKFQWFDLPPFPKPKSPHSEWIRLKRRKWQSWAGLSEKKPCLFLASPQALLKKTDISLNIYTFKKGEILNRSILKDYEGTSVVERPGEFYSRSFLIDIFSPAYDSPLRIQLSGDHIQSIHLLDREFKRRQTELDQALIPSLYEWSWTGEDRKKLCDHLREQENLLSCVLPQELFKSFSRGHIYFGFESLLNCLNSTCSLDFFPYPPQIWLFEPEKTKAHFFEEKSMLEREHILFTSENLFLDWQRIEENNTQLLEKQGLKQSNLKRKKSNDQNIKTQKLEKEKERNHLNLEKQEKRKEKLNSQKLEQKNDLEHCQPETLKTNHSLYPLVKVGASYPKNLSLKHKNSSSNNQSPVFLFLKISHPLFLKNLQI